MTHAVRPDHFSRFAPLRALACTAALITAAACDRDNSNDTEADTEADTFVGADSQPTEHATYYGDTDTDDDYPDTTGALDSSGGVDPSDSTGGAGGCLPTGSYVGTLVDREDLYGHFPYLMLFYAPARPDETTEEAFEFLVAPDGTVSIDVAARDSGSGNGHTGLAGLTATLDGACAVESTDTQVPFTSDTGPFGTITVNVQGNLPPTGLATLDLTLSGGGIPNGSITYFVELAPN